MQKEIFVSSARLKGDLAGVFEYDGETGYFYLYRTKDGGGTKIIDSLHIVSGPLDFEHDDVLIQWDDSETKVALFVNKAMWAVFDCYLGQKFGGGYNVGGRPAIPASIIFVKSLH